MRNFSTRPPWFFSCVEKPVRRVPTAETIEQHAHLNAVRLPLDESLEHLRAEFAILPDVDAEVDAAARVADALDQRRHEFVAILEHLDRAAPLHRRADQTGQCFRERLRLDGRHLVARHQVFRRAADTEKEHSDCHEDRDEPDDDERGDPPGPRLDAVADLVPLIPDRGRDVAGGGRTARTNPAHLRDDEVQRACQSVVKTKKGGPLARAASMVPTGRSYLVSARLSTLTSRR